MMNYKFCFFVFTILAVASWQANAHCNRDFTSEYGRQGTFEAPNLSARNKFSVNVDKSGISTLKIDPSSNISRPTFCVYRFIANDNERVLLNFTSFKLRGNEPECSHEYVDIFVKYKPQDTFEELIGLEPANGRFCTSVVPRRLVSLHNMIVVVFFSDLELPTSLKPFFSGNYEFFKPKVNDQLGWPVKGTLCNHTVYSTDKRDGEFQSITYPGTYIKGMVCSYLFIGEPGQRIRLEFLDLDLYSGGSHCPFDSIKVHDGREEKDPVISTICGSHRSLIIYSTKEFLLITFSSMQREAELQNRGFSAFFEFSDRLVDPDFIQGKSSRHIRGSECDQRIVSGGGDTGSIISPDSRHHPNAICRYIFEGLQTSTEYEKVLLEFTEFDLKSPRSLSGPTSTTSTTTTTTTTTSTTTTSPFDVGQNVPPNILQLLNQTIASSQDQSLGSVSANASTEQCTDNYVRIYAGEQKPDQKQDPNDYDYVYCGNDLPLNVESDAASLLLEYNSGSIGGLFKAEYKFIVDFRIPGIQASSGCNYIYKSDYLKSGTFNSPRHPSWYINNINCSYTFMTKGHEVLLLQFNTFKMFNTFGEKVLGYNDACKGEDLVEIYEFSLDSNEQKILDQAEIGTFCGFTTPGPVLSSKPLRINFKTNKENVHYGFSASYNFYPTSGISTNEFVTNCGGHIFASQKNKSGLIFSPETYRPETYEKRNHICSWNITARPSFRIALDFNKFELESNPYVRGCQTASVRINLGRSKIPVEICGNLSPAKGTASHQYVSENEWISLTFISTQQASGSNGFLATWTEIKRPG